MNKDTEKTKVIFRVDKEDNQVIAVFPELAGTNSYWQNCACYTHVGQHSSCHVDYARLFTRPAKPSEFKALQEELEFLGYNLQIVKRFTKKDLESRKAQVQR